MEKLNTNLTISKSLSVGWEKTKQQYGVVLGSVALVFLLLLVLQLIESGLNAGLQRWSNLGEASVLISFLLILATLSFFCARYWIQTLTGIGLVRIQLNVIDKKPARLAQLFHAENVFWQYLAASILYAIIVIGGLILLIVPGVYWGIKYQFAFELIVDKKLEPIAALKASGVITQGSKRWLLGFGIVVLLVNIAGALLLGVGLLITIPITLLARMYVYRELSKRYK